MILINRKRILAFKYNSNWNQIRVNKDVEYHKMNVQWTPELVQDMAAMTLKSEKK